MTILLISVDGLKPTLPGVDVHYRCSARRAGMPMLPIRFHVFAPTAATATDVSLAIRAAGVLAAKGPRGDADLDQAIIVNGAEQILG